MWRIIICAVILAGCSGVPLEEKPAVIEKEPVTTVIIQESPAPSTPLPVTSTELPTVVPEESKPLLETEPSSAVVPEESAEEESDGNQPRRTVTYDQRQEGQYNIRADLENFMIVLIPPSPMDGVNLLDLLSKSSKRTKSSHKKYHPESGSKYRQSLKSGPNSHNFNFIGRNQGQQPAPHVIVEETASGRIGEFIEGRTPYRVDISSSNSDPEQLQLQQQQPYQPQPQGPQVDVLPPPYPLSYHHLINPIHLEAEPTVIQALPPQAIAGAGKFIDANGNYFRMARAIQDGSLYGLLSLDYNRVQPRQRSQLNDRLDDDDEDVGENRSIDLPLSTDNLEEAIHNYVYPPLNPLRYNPGVFDINSRAMPSDYPKYNEEDNAKTTEIELKLLGATEECGPDRKRDSYGICRFADGY